MAIAVLSMGAAALAGAGDVRADWSLDPTQSRISFVSIKADAVGEVHRFRTATGTVSDDGAVEVEIDTASVDTGIEIRDERMIEHLFASALYPTATLSMNVDVEALRAMAPGDSQTLYATGTLSLVGQSGAIDASLLVSRLSDDRVLVTTLQPVVVEAGAFALGAGVEALRELAGLPSISPAVPVSAVLVFVAD
ncbi:MAG: YceI family protein [Pseudomonadota bacterium]